MIRLGVIGYGRRTRYVLDTIRRVDPSVRVVAIADPRADALRQSDSDALGDVSWFYDGVAMLDVTRLDGVVISTRCSSHTPLAIEVLNRDLPLFLEKPVSITWEQLTALNVAYQRSRSPVVVSFPLRVSPICEEVRRLIDEGAIGPVQHVQAVNNVPAYAATYYHGWMRDDVETGGLWLQKATHDLDYLNYLIGQQPVQLCAMESKTVFKGIMPAGLHCRDCELQDECPESPINQFDRQNLPRTPEAEDWRCSFATDTGNHDSASVIVRFASGVHAVYSQNFYTRHGAIARGATLIGYNGTISFDWYRNEIVVHSHRSGQTQRLNPGGEGHGHHGGDEGLARDFLAAINGQESRRATLAAGLQSAQLCLLARESCLTNQFQDINPLGGPLEPGQH